MDAVDNVRLVWNEVTEKGLKEVWSELSKDVDRRDFNAVTDETVKVVNETGLNNKNAKNIEELLQVTAVKVFPTTIFKN